METTEKTMNPKVQEFIENAKKALAEAHELDKQQQQLEKDIFLISLGLCTVEKEEKVNSFGDTYTTTTKTPISVTDEEFDEIKKYASMLNDNQDENQSHLDNSAEEFLGVINVISLITCGILSLIIIVNGIESYDNAYLTGVGIGIIVLSIISFSCVKVVLNISNNLHKINNKLK